MKAKGTFWPIQYFRTVSMGQESGHSLSRSSASGLTGLNSCVSQGCGLIWGLTREESASVGRLGPCGSRALRVSFLLAVGWRLPSAPYHVDLPTQSSHTWQLVPWKLARELMFSYSSSFIIDVTSVSPLLFLQGRNRENQEAPKICKPATGCIGVRIQFE